MVFKLICTEIDEKEMGFRRVFDKLWLDVALPECLSFVNHVALMTASCFVFVWHLFLKTTRSVSGLNKEK